MWIEISNARVLILHDDWVHNEPWIQSGKYKSIMRVYVKCMRIMCDSGSWTCRSFNKGIVIQTHYYDGKQHTGSTGNRNSNAAGRREYTGAEYCFSNGMWNLNLSIIWIYGYRISFIIHSNHFPYHTWQEVHLSHFYG
jgi:hypothetical protein